ncbi:MAG: phosphoglucosamine mutase [Alphaproteobacteria bacterium]|nr:phosphoglucosamine mutase [Alphaproteobacteria bacterium]
MTPKLFGTDGIRGVANRSPMDSETLLALSRTLAQKLLPQRPATVVIGRDTRISGYMLETALASGLVSEGVNIIYTGPIPTPAIPFLVQQYQADLGIMLTASHNPWYDNGVKVFTRSGSKLIDAEQDLINQNLFTVQSSQTRELGHAHRSYDARVLYMEYVQKSLPADFSLRGRTIVLDCANGAAYRVAPELFAVLNAQLLIVLHNAPDGRNINLNCGATDLKALQQAVCTHKADIGLAFDGDADRLIAVDELGNVLDGDQIMATVVHHWAMTEGFRGDLVCTVMSNKGLDRFLSGIGVTVHRTSVGDRHVIARMHEIDARFGGEQSGHMIFRDYGHTGDGILSALQLLNILQTQDIPASRIGTTFAAMAQKMINIPMPVHTVDLGLVSTEARELVGDEGQVLVRPSGTEPILRVMAQAEDAARAQQAVDSVANALGHAN